MYFEMCYFIDVGDKCHTVCWVYLVSLPDVGYFCGWASDLSCC